MELCASPNTNVVGALSLLLCELSCASFVTNVRQSRWVFLHYLALC